MKSSQGQRSAVAEAGQPAGLNGHRQKAGKQREPAPELPALPVPPTLETRSKRVRKGATGKLHAWLTELEQEQPTQKTVNPIDESLAFLQTLVEGSPDAIFIKDAEGRYLFVNDTFAFWMQRQATAVLGKTDAELFGPQLATQLAQSDAQVLTDGKAFTEEMLLDDLTLENSGAERSLLTTKVPFRDKENKIIGLLGMARDNTLRKLMEEDLREAKQFNEQVIAHAREGVVVYDADLRYVVWNAFMEEFSGLPSHKVIGRHPLEVFPTIREQGMLDLIERALAGETINSPDFLVNAGKGSRNAWARCLFGPLRDARGEVTGVIGLVSDITEYKRAEARLRRSQQFNQQVIANASEGIVVYDRELRCMVWNPVLEDLTGLLGDDVLGRQILEIAPAWREAGLGAMLQQALQGDAVEAPDLLMGQDGDRWVSARYRPLLDNDEQVIGVIGILTDVTARRQAEDALRESQQFNQQVIDSALEGIAVYDRELNVVVWNPAMEELMEVHSAQVLGANVLEVFPHLRQTESPELWQRALAGETIQGREFRFSHLADQSKCVSACYGPLCNPHGEIVGIIVTMRDVTARKLAEDALEASQQFNQQVVANAREGIIVLDNTLTYVVWNPSMELFTGLPAAKVLGKKPLEVFPTLAENGVYARLEQALKGQTLTRYDYEFDFGQGRRCFSRLDAPLRDERGVIVGVISTVSEITARKRAEEALRESQQFNQEIIASAREGIVVYDRELRIRVWNPAMADLSGVPSAAALGHEIYEIFPHFRDTAVPGRLAEALGGQTAVSKDFQLRAGTSGQGAWLSARYAPHRNSKGEIVGVIVTMRDVTSRKLAEDKLRKSEERYREILATIQDGFFEIDFAGELQFCNEALCAICGVTPEEMAAPRELGLLTPESEARMTEVFNQVRATGVPVKTFEFEIQRRDGARRALETSISLVKHPDGTAYSFRGIVRDVTERKLAERAIQVRDERFRALIEHSYDCIVLLSAEGKSLYVSPSYTRIHGYTPEEVVGSPLAERVHPADIPMVRRLSQELAPGASAPVEYRLRHKSGDYHWVEGRVTNLLEEPSVRAYVINFHDITARKAAEAEQARAEAQLQASEARFRALVENGFDGISLQDAAGVITYVSPAYTRLLGYTAAEVVGRAPLAKIHPDHVDEAWRVREEIAKTPGARRTTEFRTRHKDGSWRWLEVTMTNLLNEPNVGALVVNFRDITARNAAEAAMRASEEKFRAIWDNALDAMLIVNDEMQYVDANPAACKLYGVTREELIAQTMADFVRPERKDSARLSLHKLVAQGERKGQFQLLRNDHTLHEIEYSSRANFLPGLHLSIMRDVTARHRAAESLRASEEQYRSLVNVLEEGILMLDSEGELLTCNESAERILGARRDALRERGLINPDWRAIREDGTPFPPEEAPSTITLRTKQPCLGVVFGCVRPDGDLRWLSVNSQPVFHQDSTDLQAVVLSVTDITQRKTAELALRESEVRFSTAFDASPLAIALVEQSSGKLVNVNQAWSKLFGYTSVEAIGHTALELGLWAKPEAREEFFRQMALHGGAWEQETLVRTHAGRTAHAWLSVRAVTLGPQQYVILLALDITERKRAAETVRISEERFSKAFNACPEPMALQRLSDGRYINANQAAQRVLGMEEHELLGRTNEDIELWVDKQQRDEVRAALLAHGEVRDVECDYYLGDGRVGRFLVSAELIEIEGVQHVLSVARDITERKRAEEALRASEERFAKAFNSSPQPIAITTLPEGRFITVNAAWTRVLGYSAEETVGRDAAELRLLVERAERKLLLARLAHGAAIRDFEVTVRAKDGTHRYLIVFSEIVQLAGENYLLLTALDVTERKLAERALRATEERFRLLFERNLAGIYRATLDGRYLECNEAYASMFGFASPEEMRAAGAWCLYPEPQMREAMLAQVRQQGSLTNHEMHLRRKDGSEIWTLSNVTLRPAEGDTSTAAGVIEGVVLDISKRKQDEAKLAESREQLRALSARLSAIREEERTAIAREIHDSLGQLLTGLKLDVAWLHKRLTANKAEEAQEVLLKKTESMSDLLDNTIQTVRDLATQLRPGVLDTLGLTAAIEWQVQDFQTRTGIECEVWLCPEPKDLAKEKSTAIFRILQEILTNIIRHAEASRVVIHLLPAEGALLLSVADNGRGITTGNLRDAKSLGLLGMRERALMVGGEVNFEGALDRGTTVSVKVPL